MSDQINPALKTNLGSSTQKIKILNLIKALIILPGITYHVAEYLNFPEQTIDVNWFVNIFTTYARIFYYTAFIATIAVFFPIGLKIDRPLFNLKRILIAVSGLIFLSYVYYDPEAPFFMTEWTFYHFALSALLLINLVLKKLSNKFFNYVLLAVSFSILWIPFWTLSFNFLPYAVKVPLIGDCGNSAYGEWPLLPWIFLCTFCVSFARLLDTEPFFKKISAIEIFFWLIPIIWLGYRYWGDYYDEPTDIYFSCGVFAQKPGVFFAHVLPYFFLIRLNFVEKIKKYFDKNSFLKFLEKFSWVNNFGACYLLSLLTMGVLSLIYTGEYFQEGLRYFVYMGSILISLLVPEIVLRTLKTNYRK